jgi:mono/diheme cytochrome c family protein
LKSSPTANTTGKLCPSAKPPPQRARPADNKRTFMMHKAFRIGLAAYALAGGGAIASAQDQVEAGAQLYEEHCMGCHGEKLKAPGTSFDLRKLTAEQRSRFDKFVLEGKGQMPPWRGTLNEAELDQLWAYIRAHAY